MLKQIVAGVLLVLVATCIATGVAQAKPALGLSWPADQLVSMNAVNHAEYGRLLAKYVDQHGYVDYQAWKNSDADRQALLDYLGRLSRASRAKTATKAGRLAFWINAYNAVTIEGILQQYPTSSIRNHTARVFGYNIWQDLPLHVGGDNYSLEQIEHEILREMGEPRIHFAIVCASVGCPRLRNEAYVPGRLEAQLADNARDFFSRPQNFRADPRNRTIYVSSILSWFADDFGDSQVERFADLKPYLPQPARALAVDPRTRVKYIDYDWSLNDQRRR